MGFRYIGISGIAAKNIEVCAYALYSDFDTIGSFEWKIKENNFELLIDVPVSTECTVQLPDGSTAECGSGQYRFRIGK